MWSISSYLYTDYVFGSDQDKYCLLFLSNINSSSNLCFIELLSALSFNLHTIQFTHFKYTIQLF